MRLQNVEKIKAGSLEMKEGAERRAGIRVWVNMRGGDAAQDTGTGSLIWATLGSRPRNDDEKVEEDAKRSEAEDDGCDSDVDPPEVVRERTTEEQQPDLQHQR